MSEEAKNPAHRPSKYAEDMPQRLLSYFSLEPFKKCEITGRIVANRMPTFERFAANNGVTHKTLHNWCKEHPEFLLAYEEAKDMQKDFLITNGMNGLFNGPFTVFVAKNITDMRDKQEIDHNNPDGKLTPGVISIAAKKVPSE